MMDPKKLSELQGMSPADLLKAMRENKANKKTLKVQNDYEQFFADLWLEIFAEKNFDTQTDFFELGGTSLQAVLMLSKIKEKYNVEFDLVDLFKSTTIENQAKLIQEMLLNGPQERKEFNYQQDIELTNNINLDGIKESTNKVEQILLTGVTGFLGIHLLKELLKNPKLKVTCLVRAASANEGINRVLLCAKKYHIKFDTKEIDRISCFCGDLDKDQLGLSVKEYTSLTHDIDLIIHSAAMVNFVYPYETLRQANVLSVYELMKIASSIKIKPIHFISSIGIFNSLFTKKGIIINEDTPLPDEQPFSGYFQTKLVAEKMCREARKKGIPISVYRPSGISINTETQVSSDDDLTFVFLNICKKINAFPSIDSITDIVPVNYVAQSVVHLALNYPTAQNDYHLISGQKLHLNELSGHLKSAIPAIVPYDDFFKKALQFTQNTDDIHLKNIQPLLVSGAFSQFRADQISPIFQNKKTATLLNSIFKPNVKETFMLLVSKV